MNTTAYIIRPIFQSLIGSKHWTAKEFHERWTATYGFQMRYTSFMELINNNTSWKLAYALSIAEFLDTDVNELFELVKYE